MEDTLVLNGGPQYEIIFSILEPSQINGKTVLSSRMKYSLGRVASWKTTADNPVSAQLLHNVHHDF